MLHANAKFDIALTFDDAPRSDTIYLNGVERTDKLLQVLKEKNVKQVAFFCNTFDFRSDDQERIKKYSNAGHVIANHTAHHIDYQKSTFDQFTADFLEAEQKLSSFPTYQKWFRFPYLKQGLLDSSRNQIHMFLEKNNYKHGYVTVETYDWELDRLFQTDVASKRPIDLYKVRDVYLKILWDGIQFYDNLARKVLGRSPKHVILLHENDVNALFIGDLIDLIRKNNGQIVSIDEAYRDSIAKREFDLLPFSQRRMRSLAKYEKYQGSTVSQWEDEQEIAKLYHEKVVNK